MPKSSPRFPNKFLVFGSLFILAGVVLLLRSFGFLPRLAALWPVVLILTGMTLLYLVIVLKRGPESYVFLGMILGLGGIVLFLMNTVLTTVGMERIWPIFMTVTGVSLFFYGMKKHGDARISLTVPGVSIVLLSFVFLPFSLEWMSQSFSAFVADWWPILFIVLGIVLIGIYVGRDLPRR